MNLIALWDLKKKVTERTHPNGRGPKGINERQQGLQVDTKGCSFGASEVGSEEKGLLSTTTTEKLTLWDWRCDYTGVQPVQNMTIPSQITAAYPILLIWRLYRKSPFDCCAWLTWRDNKFSKHYFPSNYLDLLQDKPMFARRSNTQGMLAPGGAERPEGVWNGEEALSSSRAYRDLAPGRAELPFAQCWS